MSYKRSRIPISKEFLDKLKSWKKRLCVGSYEDLLELLMQNAITDFHYGWISRPMNNLLVIKCSHCNKMYDMNLPKGLKFVGNAYAVKPCPRCSARLYNIIINKMTMLENQIGKMFVGGLKELPPLKGVKDESV